MNRHNIMAGLMVSCTLLVAAWLFLAHRSRGPYKPYDLTPEDFAAFNPVLEGWTVQKLPVAGQDDVDANIVAFSLKRVPAAQLSVISHRLSVAGDANDKEPETTNSAGGTPDHRFPASSTDHRSPITDHRFPASSTDHRSPITDHRFPASSTDHGSRITDHRFLVRLVHGYNMPMCMKIKYYKVEKVQDHKVNATTDPKLKSAFTVAEWGRLSVISNQLSVGSQTNNREPITNNVAAGIPATIPDASSPDKRQPTTDNRLLITDHSLPSPSPYPLPVQLWRLTSSVGTVAYWATTMIRSGDFSPTDVDTCSMAFPRVDIPDDPSWVPRGFATELGRNPVDFARRWFRGKWDAARWDWLTFLKVRQPVRGSDELLTYITLVEDVGGGEDGMAVIPELLEAHQKMLRVFQGMERGVKSGDRSSVISHQFNY